MGRLRGQTLTRRGAHTSCPELPQDETLLALSQGQEELIGFYALLAEIEVQCPQLWQGQLDLQHQLRICLSVTIHISQEPTGDYSLDKARDLLCYNGLLQIKTRFEKNIRESIMVGEASWLSL
jgi:hypothetical protein